MQNSMTSWSGKHKQNYKRGFYITLGTRSFVCCDPEMSVLAVFNPVFSFNLIINNQRSLENWFIRNGSELQRFGCFISVNLNKSYQYSVKYNGVCEKHSQFIYTAAMCACERDCTHMGLLRLPLLHWCIIIHHGWRSGRFHMWFFHVHKSHRHRNDLLLHFCPFAYAFCLIKIHTRCPLLIFSPISVSLICYLSSFLLLVLLSLPSIHNIVNKLGRIFTCKKFEILTINIDSETKESIFFISLSVLLYFKCSFNI